MEIKIIIGIVSTLGGFFLGYLTSYFKEKGKNRALIQDMERLTEEKEKVSSKYQLDISKRKYKYEDKRAQYFKYFNLLDSLTSDNQRVAHESFIPASEIFNRKFLEANGNESMETKATADFGASINKLMFKTNESLLKLKQETNSIKLIAGPNVSKVLQELEIAYEDSMKGGAEMMKDFTNNVVKRKTGLLNKQLEETERTGLKLIKLKEKLLQEIKNELDEI